MSVDGAPPSPTPEALVEEAGRRARIASHLVAGLPTGVKNDALNDIADALLADGDRILKANELDVRDAERRRQPDALIDQLILTWPRLGYIAEGVRAVASLTDPVGEVLRGSRRPNGLITYEVRVPMGVVGIVYEARPNVTVDAISLCLKAGNAVLLLGGEDAARSNRALLEVIKRSTARQGIPEDAIQLIDTAQAPAIERLMHLREYVDVLIPRGSPELVRRISENATVRIIEVGLPGNCHIFVERSARLDMAADIAFNAKVQRPGSGNSMETLLVDRPIAAEFLPIVGPRMQAAGVELRGCDLTRTFLPGLKPATEEDWTESYLGLTLAVKVVDSLDHAVAHIARYGQHHSEAIITQDYFAGKRFIERVDAAAVYINASTRFTDAFEFGLGAELGISTQKLHRRGPIGLRALTTWKWIVQGEGQVRD
jgi:glutamate-5-semialdehyde dehydrogenase